MNNVEAEAIEIVKKYLQKEERTYEDVSKNDTFVGIDIISENLRIEVKGRGKDKAPHFYLNEYNIQGLKNTDDKNYRLFLVMNPKENPRIIIFTKEEIEKKMKEKIIWKIPLRKKDYSKAISFN